jgi:hypothetical protein
MVELVFGIALLVVGVIGVTNGLGVVHHFGKLWPRPYTQGDASNFYSAGFLVRFVSLLLAATGIALILLAFE